MIAAQALALLLATAAPVSGAAPADARLDAFRAACLPDHRLPAKRPAVFLREGWSPVDDADDPMLAEVMKLSRDLAEEGKADGATWDLSSWRKQAEGRPFYLVLATVRSPRTTFTGCFLYDFTSLVPVDPDLVGAWLREAPVQTVDRVGLIARIWDAGTIEGATEVQTAIVAPASQAEAIVGFTGVSIKISSRIDEGADAAPKDPA